MGRMALQDKAGGHAKTGRKFNNLVCRLNVKRREQLAS
jgi:hypothetical protein